MILPTIYIARKFQIFPDEQQKKIINDTFGCCRFMWNKLLEKAIHTYFDENETFNIVNYGDIVSEHPFLDKSNKELIIDRHAVSHERMFLNQAFKNFFDKWKKMKIKKFRKDGKPWGFPRFKKKTNKQSYSDYQWQGVHINWNDKLIKIPKIGWVKFSNREKQHPEHWILGHITISESSSGKYYISMHYHYTDDRDGIHGVGFIMNPKSELNILGLDYSSKSLYVDSNGNSAEYPKYYRKAQKRLRMFNKKLSRQTKYGKNWNKTRVKLAKLHEHISNQRKDFLHKLSGSITKNYDVIGVEDINMQNMSQSLKLGKSTTDNSFGIFRYMLQYKQNRQPFHIVVRADMWFCSSKMCHRCGYIKKDLQLKDRVYECPSCGLTIDRDWNAAINLRNEALRIVNTWSDERFVLT
jgi:putative transposase